MFTDEQIERFWRNVDVKGPDECWDWKLSTDRCKYGKTRIGKAYLLAHRVAYMIKNGHIDGSVMVLHGCDNSICCNPAHLHPGTHLDNMRERGARGRAARKFTPCKLSQEKADAIRREFEGGKPKHELARTYHVSPQTIRAIVARKYWNHAAA